jgi:heme-degrading monooxygenase HmoA
MARIASFHLVRDHPGRQPLVLARLGTDRIRLRDVEGLRFWRLLGTGAEDDTAPSADLRRSALFAVWDDESDLDHFLAEHALARRWRHAAEHWHVRMLGAGGHGAWHGVPVLDLLDRGTGAGPVAIITRANVSGGSLAAFSRAGRPVSDEVRRAPGLLGVVGIGEAPILRLGTFSVWASLEHARAFAAMPEHRAVVRRTRSEGWYGEELFARFEPIASWGSWAGRDPLDGR